MGNATLGLQLGIRHNATKSHIATGVVFGYLSVEYRGKCLYEQYNTQNHSKRVPEGSKYIVQT